MRETVVDVGVDRTQSLDDFIDAPRRNAEVFGQMPDTDPSRSEELFSRFYRDGP